MQKILILLFILSISLCSYGQFSYKTEITMKKDKIINTKKVNILFAFNHDKNILSYIDYNGKNYNWKYSVVSEEKDHFRVLLDDGIHMYIDRDFNWIMLDRDNLSIIYLK